MTGIGGCDGERYVVMAIDQWQREPHLSFFFLGDLFFMITHTHPQGGAPRRHTPKAYPRLSFPRYLLCVNFELIRSECPLRLKICLCRFAPCSFLVGGLNCLFSHRKVGHSYASSLAQRYIPKLCPSEFTLGQWLQIP